jgi:hypothetical protein
MRAAYVSETLFMSIGTIQAGGSSAARLGDVQIAVAVKVHRVAKDQARQLIGLVDAAAQQAEQVAREPGKGAQVDTYA